MIWRRRSVRVPRRLLEDIKLVLVSPWQASQNHGLEATPLIDEVNRVLGNDGEGRP